MAIPPDAYGYPDAEITADKLPIWQQPLSRFSVEKPDDWKVSALVSIDRGIRVEVGTGSGDAVTDVTHEYETMSLPKPDVASRWYLIVRRRNWAGDGTSTLVAIPGTASLTPTLPSRFNAPGERSDQPLAMVRVTQADSTVQQVVDLRCWASNGGVEVANKLALEYLGEPGAAVKLGRSVWRYESQGNGVWGWAEPTPPMLVQGVPAGSVPIIKSGVVALANPENTRTTTNPAGDGYHYFTEPFPNQMISCVVMPANNPAMWNAATENFHLNYNGVYSNKTRLSVRVYDKNGAAVGNRTGIYVSYLAVGY